MKILSKEEEDAHYRAVVVSGTKWGLVGLACGLGSAYVLNKRSTTFRQMAYSMKVYIVSSCGMVPMVLGADKGSRAFEAARYQYRDPIREEKMREKLAVAKMSLTERAKALGRRYRWHLVGGSWLVSMIGAMAIVSRNKYLTTSQKIVQARMYAQGLTLGVLIASAGLSVSDDGDADRVPTSEETIANEWKRMIDTDPKS